MPATQYTAIANRDDELEDAFEASDDEESTDNRPLLPHSSHSLPHHDNEDDDQPPNTLPNQPQSQSANNNVYNFEYDFPPPGSPPADLAVANHWGNTNGVIPDFNTLPIRRPTESWVSRTWNRLTGKAVVPNRPIGGGTQNDGVFANVSARPVAPTRAPPAVPVDGPDNVYHVPEVESNDAPPSYNVAQADAPPGYWENTVFASATNDFIVDSLPTGSMFAFLWSFFLSFSLQWIGFAMAYMLATSHAGRFGARAGFGVTLVQVGIYFRSEGELEGNNTWPEDSDASSVPAPTISGLPGNWTLPGTSPDDTAYLNQDEINAQLQVARDWISMFLMTLGWFIFLTSILGYWRVKRWENSITTTSAARPAPVSTRSDEDEEVQHLPQHLQSFIPLNFVLAQGLGLRNWRSQTIGRDSIEDHLEAVMPLNRPAENDQRRETENEVDVQLRRALWRSGAV